MDWLSFVLIGLATWRLSNMLVREDGPAFLFYKLRDKAGIFHDADHNVLMVPDKFLPQLLSCVWCTSIWVGFGWMIFWVLEPFIAVRFAAVFALSAVAIIIDRCALGH